jgi:nucleotide-binding universal stress UspA family protein
MPVMFLRTILHATDLTPSSRPAFEQALELADEFGARLVLLHAAEVLPRSHARACLPSSYSHRRQQLAGDLRGLAGPNPVVPMEYVLSEDDPVSAIVRTAAARDCNLIVMGGHTPRGLPGLLAGVAEQVIRWAHCPVLVVKATPPSEPAPFARVPPFGSHGRRAPLPAGK